MEGTFPPRLEVQTLGRKAIAAGHTTLYRSIFDVVRDLGSVTESAGPSGRSHRCRCREIRSGREKLADMHSRSLVVPPFQGSLLGGPFGPRGLRPWLIQYRPFRAEFADGVTAPGRWKVGKRANSARGSVSASRREC